MPGPRLVIVVLFITGLVVAVFTITKAIAKSSRPEETRPIAPGSAGEFFKDFCVFRRLIAPVIIQFIFWLGLLVCLCVAMRCIKVAVDEQESAYLVSSVLMIFVAPLILRLVCEFLILFFRLAETLTDVKNETGAIRRIIGKDRVTSNVDRNAET